MSPGKSRRSMTRAVGTLGRCDVGWRFARQNGGVGSYLGSIKLRGRPARPTIGTTDPRPRPRGTGRQAAWDTVDP